MKKILFAVVLIFIILVSVACMPFRIVIEYEPPEVPKITEPITEDGLWDGEQPQYGRTENGIGYVAADGYKWSTLDETIMGSYLLYLGCNDCIDNWKQVPEDWKIYE